MTVPNQPLQASLIVIVYVAVVATITNGLLRWALRLFIKE